MPERIRNSKGDTMNLRIISGLILFLFLGTNVQLTAQDCDTTLHQFCEKEPEFPGGIGALYQFLGDQIIFDFKPEESIYFKVYLQFDVLCDGRMTNIVVFNSKKEKLPFRIKNGEEKIPIWTPAYSEGVPIRMRMTFPVNIHWQ